MKLRKLKKLEQILGWHFVRPAVVLWKKWGQHTGLALRAPGGSALEEVEGMEGMKEMEVNV